MDKLYVNVLFTTWQDEVPSDKTLANLLFKKIAMQEDWHEPLHVWEKLRAAAGEPLSSTSSSSTTEGTTTFDAPLVFRVTCKVSVSSMLCLPFRPTHSSHAEVMK